MKLLECCNFLKNFFKNKKFDVMIKYEHTVDIFKNYIPI